MGDIRAGGGGGPLDLSRIWPGLDLANDYPLPAEKHDFHGPFTSKCGVLVRMGTIESDPRFHEC